VVIVRILHPQMILRAAGKEPELGPKIELGSCATPGKCAEASTSSWPERVPGCRQALGYPVISPNTRESLAMIENLSPSFFSKGGHCFSSSMDALARSYGDVADGRSAPA
jgi:hypothetical protein